MASEVDSLWRRKLAEGRALTQERRARVLAYPDLAARLCQAPLGFARPQQWNGYVPPRMGQYAEPELLRSSSGHPNRHGHRTDPEQLNDSPRRAVLVSICAEALQREGMAGE
jgi:hypothetical protein